MESMLDPFEVRMVFLRVGWMAHYRGLGGNDAITGGGAYVAEHGYGSEIFNFEPFTGNVYGYVQPPRGNSKGNSRIHIERLGASRRDASLTGVLAIWVAKSPQDGTSGVIGWYQNATIFRDWQPSPSGSQRQYAGEELGYYVTAKNEDATLLPVDERVFSLPQKGTGSFGQSNVWYADNREYHDELRQNVLRYIATRRTSEMPPAVNSSLPRQTDPFLRQKVEQAAIAAVTDYYVSHGYRVDSFEKDNVGWDLTATRGDRELKLEVKGLSGGDVVIQLTPNEYAMMQAHRNTYRICVVRTALTAPQLEIFSFVRESGQWESAERRRLDIEEIVAARCFAN